MRDVRLIAAVKERDPGSGPGSCAYRAAVGGQPSDAVLGVQRDQVGNEERPVKRFPAAARKNGL